MSGSKPRFRRISLTLGRKKRSVDERYMDIQRDSVADQNGKKDIYLCQLCSESLLCMCVRVTVIHGYCSATSNVSVDV